MAKGTKEKILVAALEIFSRDGFAGTNIKDIADAVGIVKSALYRHFESKEEIWNAVFSMMVDYYGQRLGAALVRIPRSTDELAEMTLRMVEFTVHDEKVVKMRKILLTEQFRDEKVRNMASHYFLYDTEQLFAKIFSEMMMSGCLKKSDPEMLAFSYTTPITALVHLCDREPERMEEALRKVRQFVDHFIAEYAV